MEKEKPGGIVILAILYILSGIFALGGGAIMFGLGGGVLAAVGGFVIIVGIIDFVIAFGLWNLQPWARIVAIIFAIIGLLSFPIGTIISVIILWYLFKPEIKEAFQ